MALANSASLALCARIQLVSVSSLVVASMPASMLMSEVVAEFVTTSIMPAALPVQCTS